ncbi:MAG: 50S ribosomal protein L35 [Jatrophihabitans sp.]
MPKHKTHSGTKKRVKVTSTGKLFSQPSGMRHHLELKSSRVTRRLSGTTEISKADRPRIKKLLGL